MTTFKEAEAKLAAMTPEERAAHTAKLKADARTTSLIGTAAAAGVGFLIFGPIGIIAAPAGLFGLALLMGNRN